MRRGLRKLSGTMVASAGTVVAALCLLGLAGTWPGYAQQVSTATPLPTSSYLSRALPSRILGLVMVHGNRFYTPGSERVTYNGTYTDGTGTKSAVLTTEIPNKVRLAIGGSAAKVLVAAGATTSVAGSPATGTDQNVLESLASDGLEGFFFTFNASAGRLLGGLFRMDGGKNPNYAGPYYDIWETFQQVSVRPGTPVQQKVFYFDSHTGQFARCRYKIQSSSGVVDVQTHYSEWQLVNGQLLPGRIERFENGISVFAFAASNSAVSQALNDGIFANP